MKPGIFLFAVLICLNSGCSKKSDVINILPLQPNSKAFSAKVVKSIPLSNQNEVAIGSIDKLVVYKDRIYVFDNNQVNGLLIFSETGTFLKKISMGHGPGEMIHPKIFNIIDNQLIIYDAPGQPYFRYYTPDGEFLFTKTLPFGWVVYSFENYNDKYLLIQGSTDSLIKQDTSKVHKYHVIDKKLSKCYQSYIETTDGLIRLSENKPISYYDGKFLLLARPYNYIYQLDEKNISKKYFIDFESFNYKEADVSQGRQHILSLFQEGRRIGLLDHIFENKTLVCFTYASFANGSDVPVIFSKSTHESANFNEVLADSGLPEVELVQTTGNDLICLFTPGNFDESSLKKYAASGFIPNGTTPDSNPVVTILEMSAKN
ncbi:MAG: 6-bladed beta-propeller [Bacteroidia bacterium]|nr:6-bladed beta-propeller [Bacteroidia bacterium]